MNNAGRQEFLSAHYTLTNERFFPLFFCFSYRKGKPTDLGIGGGREHGGAQQDGGKIGHRECGVGCTDGGT